MAQVFTEAQSDKAVGPGRDKSGLKPCVGKSAPRVGMAMVSPWVLCRRPDGRCDPKGLPLMPHALLRLTQDEVLSPSLGVCVSSLPSLSAAGRLP